MENPLLWTPAFKEDQAAVPESVDLKTPYAEDTMPRGVLGLNATMFKATCASSPTAAPPRSAWKRCSSRKKTRSRG
jgi:hypothetical protein